jgi:hypothetical protein
MILVMYELRVIMGNDVVDRRAYRDMCKAGMTAIRETALMKGAVRVELLRRESTFTGDANRWIWHDRRWCVTGRQPSPGFTLPDLKVPSPLADRLPKKGGQS